MLSLMRGVRDCSCFAPCPPLWFVVRCFILSEWISPMLWHVYLWRLCACPSWLRLLVLVPCEVYQMQGYILRVEDTESGQVRGMRKRLYAFCGFYGGILLFVVAVAVRILH